MILKGKLYIAPVDHKDYDRDKQCVDDQGFNKDQPKNEQELDVISGGWVS